MACTTGRLADKFRDRVIGVTVTAVVGTSQQVFTFDAPTLSAIEPPNSPATARNSATMIGVNFATVEKAGFS